MKNINQQYKVVQKLFFANDVIIEKNLSFKEAQKLKKKYDDGNGDDTYRWYTIEPMTE